VLDLLFIVIALAFFALAALFVRFCDHIVGPDDAVEVPADEDELIKEVAR
jgi:hypothetical protein